MLAMRKMLAPPSNVHRALVLHAGTPQMLFNPLLIKSVPTSARVVHTLYLHIFESFRVYQTLPQESSWSTIETSAKWTVLGSGFMDGERVP